MAFEVIPVENLPGQEGKHISEKVVLFVQTEYIQMEIVFHCFKAIFSTRNKDKWQKTWLFA